MWGLVRGGDSVGAGDGRGTVWGLVKGGDSVGAGEGRRQCGGW